MIRTEQTPSTEAESADTPSSRPLGVIPLEDVLHADGDAPSIPQLLQAFATAMIAAVGDEEGERSNEYRRAASASHALGIAYRRQERCEDARRAHLAAMRLRKQHGSFEELWDTAVELALDARIDGQWEDSRRWSMSAIDFAKEAPEQSCHMQAIAWADLSRMLTESGDHEDAINAAEEAAACRKRHDVGAINTAKSEQLLGDALLEHAKFLSDENDPGAKIALDVAIERLDVARASLEAFGQVAATDAQSCRDGLDFAQRLRATIDE